MPKDRLVRTSGRNILDKGNKRGTVRIKPAKKVGKDEDGNLVQNIVRKYPDGSKSTERFSKGEKVGETYTPKKLRKKKTRKLRNPRPKLKKAGKTPNYEVKLSKMGPDERKAWEKQERNKKLAARYNKRNKNIFTRLMSKIKGGVSPLNMNAPKFDSSKGWKKGKAYTTKGGVKGHYVTDPKGKKYFMTSSGKLHTGQIDDLTPEPPAPSKYAGEGFMNPPYKDTVKGTRPYANRQGYHGYKNFKSNLASTDGNRKVMKDGPKTNTVVDSKIKDKVKGGVGNWKPHSQRGKK
tara:strand:+ start:218 stop:1093 length:876 start_codon:yes stop_codon:yes gene_type:complete